MTRNAANISVLELGGPPAPRTRSFRKYQFTRLGMNLAKRLKVRLDRLTFYKGQGPMQTETACKMEAAHEKRRNPV